MGSDWSSSCAHQIGRDPALQNSILLGLGSCTIVLFVCVTIVSALLWRRWWLHRNAEDGPRGWRLYGFFIALLCVGSASGCVGWSARIKQRQLQYSVKNDAAISNALVYAVSNQWAAVFCVFYSVSFLCTSVSKLMILDRIKSFAAHALSEAGQARVGRGAVLVLGSVVTVDCAGIAANFAAAYFWSQGSQRQTAAAVFLEQGNPSNATAFQDAQTSYETALLAESVQRMCEVAVLVFIASAFVVGFSLMYRTSDALAPKRERKFELSIMRLSVWDQGLSQQDTNDASSGGDAGSARSTTQFMKRIYSLGFIFFMFLLRAVWSCLVIRGDLGRFNASCAPCDGSCQDQGTLVNTYLFFSPEFAFTVIVLSEPLSYLVAIYSISGFDAADLHARGEQSDL